MRTEPEERRVRRGWVNTAAATAVFAVVHSATATGAAKAGVAGLVGTRARDALYRPAYNLLAVLTSLTLLFYIRRQPARMLYHVRGAPAGMMRAAQAAALLYGAWAAWWVGPLRFSGLPGLGAWLLRRQHVPAPPEGQNPPPDEGLSPPAGPFRLTRHPLNLILVPLFWLNPRMTSTLAAFAAVTGLYALLGSIHTERRLRRTYGREGRDAGRRSITTTSDVPAAAARRSSPSPPPAPAARRR